MNRNWSVVLLGSVLLAGPIMGADFDAQGNRLDTPEKEGLSYQWVDPKTGKTVTKPYPPANLQMRQVERRGNLVILEVLGTHRFADSVNLNTPKSAGSGSSYEMYTNLPAHDEAKVKLAAKRHIEIINKGDANPSDLKALIDAKKRFEDAHELATRTPRIALAGPIARMQDVRQAAERQSITDCYQKAQNALVRWMNTLLKKMTGFMSGSGATADLYATIKDSEAMDQEYDFWLTVPIECNGQ